MDAHARAALVARASYGRLVALLAARNGDIAGAEEALSDAFVSALETWPRTGIPDKPEAWLMQAAKNRRIDAFRRNARSPVMNVDELPEVVDEEQDEPMNDAVKPAHLPPPVAWWPHQPLPSRPMFRCHLGLSSRSLKVFAPTLTFAAASCKRQRTETTSRHAPTPGSALVRLCEQCA